MFTLFIAFVCGCLFTLAVDCVLVLVCRRRAVRKPQAARVASYLIAGMGPRQATQLWTAGAARGLAVRLVGMAHGTFGLEVNGTVCRTMAEAQNALRWAAVAQAC